VDVQLSIQLSRENKKASRRLAFGKEVFKGY